VTVKAPSITATASPTTITIGPEGADGASTVTMSCQEAGSAQIDTAISSGEPTKLSDAELRLFAHNLSAILSRKEDVLSRKEEVDVMPLLIRGNYLVVNATCVGDSDEADVDDDSENGLGDDDSENGLGDDDIENGLGDDDVIEVDPGDIANVDDPVGDQTTLSGQPAEPGTLPAAWDIIRYERQGARHTAVLANECSPACLAEMRIAGAQLIARRPDGGVEATVILQKNEQDTFDQSTNGNPALMVNSAEFTGFSFVFDADGSGLPDGVTFEVAVRGSTTTSIDDGAEDFAGPIPTR
jgi:hypothetical protein